jgi:predicted SAM-dependent methyltransferase
MRKVITLMRLMRRHGIRKTIELIMAKAVPIYLIEQVIVEVRFATKRMFTARSVRRTLVSQNGRRVNIGCGTNPIQGWINLDVIPHSGVYFWDCRSGLPFFDSSIAAIYSEHFFEHLDFYTEAHPFLRECLRCLQPRGVLRIVVPDAGAYLRAYSGPWEQLADMRPLYCTPEGWRDRWLGQIYQTKMQFMNAIFRQGYEHKYAYDEETLVFVMREAGFADVVVQQFGMSIDPKMASDSYERRTESLYVEGVKG